MVYRKLSLLLLMVGKVDELCRTRETINTIEQAAQLMFAKYDQLPVKADEQQKEIASFVKPVDKVETSVGDEEMKKLKKSIND